MIVCEADGAVSLCHRFFPVLQCYVYIYMYNYVYIYIMFLHYIYIYTLFKCRFPYSSFCISITRHIISRHSVFRSAACIITSGHHTHTSSPAWRLSTENQHGKNKHWGTCGGRIKTSKSDFWNTYIYIISIKGLTTYIYICIYSMFSKTCFMYIHIYRYILYIHIEKQLYIYNWFKCIYIYRDRIHTYTIYIVQVPASLVASTAGSICVYIFVNTHTIYIYKCIFLTRMFFHVYIYILVLIFGQLHRYKSSARLEPLHTTYVAVIGLECPARFMGSGFAFGCKHVIFAVMNSI